MPQSVLLDSSNGSVLGSTNNNQTATQQTAGNTSVTSEQPSGLLIGGCITGIIVLVGIAFFVVFKRSTKQTQTKR
jgi:hypothetical protein